MTETPATPALTDMFLPSYISSERRPEQSQCERRKTLTWIATNTKMMTGSRYNFILWVHKHKKAAVLFSGGFDSLRGVVALFAQRSPDQQATYRCLNVTDIWTGSVYLSIGFYWLSQSILFWSWHSAGRVKSNPVACPPPPPTWIHIRSDLF